MLCVLQSVSHKGARALTLMKKEAEEAVFAVKLRCRFRFSLRGSRHAQSQRRKRERNPSESTDRSTQDADEKGFEFRARRRSAARVAE